MVGEAFTLRPSYKRRRFESYRYFRDQNIHKVAIEECQRCSLVIDSRKMLEQLLENILVTRLMMRGGTGCN
jgi:regulator of RNase E activity RraA